MVVVDGLLAAVGLLVLGSEEPPLTRGLLFMCSWWH